MKKINKVFRAKWNNLQVCDEYFPDYSGMASYWVGLWAMVLPAVALIIGEWWVGLHNNTNHTLDKKKDLGSPKIFSCTSTFIYICVLIL